MRSILTKEEIARRRAYYTNPSAPPHQYRAIREASVRAGKAAEVAQKMVDILGRRTGLNFGEVGELAAEEQSGSETYLGFFVFFPSGKRALQINFKRGESDTIESIDYWTKPDATPTYTIDLQGYNIVEVVGQIADVITGRYWEYAESVSNQSPNLQEKTTRIQERRSIPDDMNEWLDSDPDLEQDIVRGNFGSYEDLHAQFNEFAATINRRGPRNTSDFKWYLKNVLRDRGVNADNIPSVSVHRGQRRTTVTDPEEESTFNQSIVENEHFKKFDLMEAAFKSLRDDSDPMANNIYVYGVGGIGKSHLAEQILKPLPNCHYQEANISGYTGLLQVLFDNRNDKIIVFDDALKKEDVRTGAIPNILKIAMLDKPVRKISIGRARRGEEGPNGEEIRVREQDGETLDLVDFGDEEGVSEEEDIYNFTFTSNIVFITNMTWIPEAVGDRALMIEMNFTREQVLELIENALEGIQPNVDMDLKRETYQFLKDYLHEAQKISFRMFKLVLKVRVTAERQGQPESVWVDWARILLQSAQEPDL